MQEKVLIAKCSCGANVAAMLLTPDSRPDEVGQLLVSTVVAGRTAIISGCGPAYVSACVCPKTREPTPAEWKAKVESLEYQVKHLQKPTGDEIDQQWRAAVDAIRRVEDVVRTAEIMQESLTVEQVTDAIHGPYTRSIR